ncbi:MAG TPA: SLBB domain-containing protein [Candidatus Acidoferrum sp.]
MNTKRLIFVSAAMGFALSGAGLASGQQRVEQRADRQTVGPTSAAPQPDVDGSKLYGGTMIGVGDIINIRIAEEDDVSGRYQVSEAGDVKIPLLEKPIHADGLSTFDLSSKLADELKKQQILKDPYVTVFIERGMTQNVTVSGPVARPGIYPIERQTKLLDVLSMSGGLAPNAGQTITITHAATEQKSAAKAAGPNSSAAPASNAGTEPKAEANVASNSSISETVDVVTLMSGDNREANVIVKPGDNITVSNASVVYVVGAVTRPGAFVVQDPKSGLSVLKAIALVEGTTSTAKMGSAIIVRKSTNEEGREEIPLDLSKIQKGRVKDPILMANDILFVPTSAMKQGLKKMGDAAQVAAGYGLGLRIAP